MTTKKQLISQLKQCILELDEETYFTLQEEHHTIAHILFNKEYSKAAIQNLIFLALQKTPEEKYFISLLEDLEKRLLI